jgi:hypothetical protein
MLKLRLLLLLLSLAVPRAGDAGESSGSPDLSRRQARLALRPDDDRMVRGKYADREQLWKTGGVVGAIADRESLSDDAAHGAQRTESIVGQESEWPTDSSAPERMCAAASASDAAPFPGAVRAKAQDGATRAPRDDALRADDDRKVRAREYADRQQLREAGGVVGAMLQDYRQSLSSRPPGPSSRPADRGRADRESLRDNAAHGVQRAGSRQGQESEWPTDSSAPERMCAAASASDAALSPGAPCAARAPPDDAWLEQDGHDEVLRHLVRLDRAIAAHGRGGDVGSEEAQDAWTLALCRAARRYDTDEVEKLVLQAQCVRDLPPGAPVWVRLPGEGGGKEVDALGMTTGQLMELLLTGGQALPRGQDGRVLLSSDSSLSLLSIEDLRVYEPFRSLLSHRVEDGQDVYSYQSSAEEEGEEEGRGGGSKGRGAQDVSAEEIMEEDGGLGVESEEAGPWTKAKDEDVRYPKGRVRGRKGAPHVDDVINLQLGPYRNRVERFICADDWNKEDAEGFTEWWDWHTNQTLAQTPPGVQRLNAQLWRAVMDGYTCEEARGLVEQGAQVNSCDAADGRSALHKAVCCADLSAVHLLLSLGADVEAHDADGRTPLLAAAGFAQMDLCGALLGAGADLLAVDDNGWSVLHWAACAGTRDRHLVQLLVRHACVHALRLPWGLVNQEGFTAAEEARRLGLDDMADYLQALGRGESGQNTRMGHGLDSPFPSTPLLQGSTCFVDSSDSQYDAQAPDAAHYRRITKQVTC